MFLDYNAGVSDVWLKAWTIQIARMKNHPEEISFLKNNAQVAQANYVMTRAQEIVDARRAIQ